MLQLPQALAAMASYRQWVVCRYSPHPKFPGKTLKQALNIHTGHEHDAHDSSIWMDADSAIATANAWNAAPREPGIEYGQGFAFTENDPFFFVDIDNCLTPDGQWTPIVGELCAALPGAAVEISHSGRGLHIFGTGQAPELRRKKDHTNELFDLYTEKRFAAITGAAIQGDVSTQHTAALHAITDKHLKRETVEGGVSSWTTGPCEGWNGPVDDTKLIERAMRSSSVAGSLGHGVTFADLWTRNVDVLAKRYLPDGNGKEQFGESEADRALAQHLAFWTGKDCARISRLMWQSALVRPKWTEHATYLNELTIMGAVAVQGNVCIDKPVELPSGVVTEGVSELAPMGQAITGQTYLDGPEQVNLFKGCSYVCDAHAVLAPGGIMLRPDQFRVMFGGYTFVVADGDDQRTSRDPWEAFTQSQLVRFARSDSSCFRPDLAAGVQVDYDGQKRSNLWWPVSTPRQVGDPAPFLQHLAALLPDLRDRTIVLSYMAAVVQHKGYKFQWCPLIQGVEGNGKTLLTRCVAFAVGNRYSYYPKASMIAKQFNDWQYGCVFAGVEDIYVAESSANVMEELKPMVTGDINEVEGKGEKKVSRELCFNLMLNSNHKDALRKNRTDRRFAIFYTAQQSAEDLAEWGMGGDYFPNLYAWLRGGGYAIVNELLHTFQIPEEFNPCVQMGGKAKIAPLTSSFEAAVSASLGSIEQEVQEAIDQGTPGFCGGWISSMAFDALLERINKAGRVPRNKRRDLLITLGYDWHPGLTDSLGRVNNDVAPDGGKPRLFIKHNHELRQLRDASAIAKAYSAAQMAAIKFGVPHS